MEENVKLFVAESFRNIQTCSSSSPTLFQCLGEVSSYIFRMLENVTEEQETFTFSIFPPASELKAQKISPGRV